MNMQRENIGQVVARLIEVTAERDSLRAECERMQAALARFQYPPEHRVSVAEAERDALQVKLKNYEPINTYDGRDIESWRTEAESLRAELEACKEDVSELRALDNEAQHGADALRAELAAANLALKLTPRPYADADLLIEERDAARAELARLRSLEEVAEADSLSRAIAASEANCDALRAELEACQEAVCPASQKITPTTARVMSRFFAGWAARLEAQDAARAQAGGK